MLHKLITTVSTTLDTVQHIRMVPIALYMLFECNASLASPTAKLRPPNIVTKGTREDLEMSPEGQ